MDNLEIAAKNGEPVDIKDYCGAFTLDTIASTAFDTKIDSLRNPNHEIVRNMKGFFGRNISLKSLIVLMYPPLMKWFNIYLFDYKVLLFLNKLTWKIFEDRKKDMNFKDEKKQDFIHLLLEAQKNDDVDDDLGSPMIKS